jgi:hypothetical protein
LDRAVLAVGAVQQWEHDVDAERVGRRGRRHGNQLARYREPVGQLVACTRLEHLLGVVGEQPASVGRDADRHDLVLRGVERTCNGNDGDA